MVWNICRKFLTTVQKILSVEQIAFALFNKHKMRLVFHYSAHCVKVKKDTSVCWFPPNSSFESVLVNTNLHVQEWECAS